MQNRLQEIPVSPRLDEVVEKSLKEVRRQAFGKRKRRIYAVCGSAAAVIGLLFAFCLVSPVMAKKLPVIGHIFKSLENQITYSGDYSGKTKLLSDDQTASAKNPYTVSSKGIKLTASEVYSDGYSVYLSLDIKAEGKKLTDQPVQQNDEINISGSYKWGKDKIWEPFSDSAQGVWLSDNHFTGIVKMDLNYRKTPRSSALLSCRIDFISGSPRGTDGRWYMDIPVSVDQKDNHVYDIKDQNKRKQGIKDVVVTPYQVIVHPYMPLGAYEDMSLEEFNQFLIKKGKAVDEPLDSAPASDEGEMWQLENWYTVAVFDQDGKALKTMGAYAKSASFATGGEKPEKITVYIGPGLLCFSDNGNKDKVEMASVYKKEIVLNK